MTEKRDTRYWGDRTPPENKVEFFNAITTPSPTTEGATIATIRMYGPIDSWGGWWGISAADVSAVIDELPESVEQIVLRINSPGGEIFEASTILNMLSAHKATVTAVGDGLVASAASYIMAGCDEAVMSPGSAMMIHSPLSIVWGNAEDMRKTANLLDTLERSIVEIYTAKAGEKDWAALLAADTWLTPTETVELGLADRTGIVKDAGPVRTAGDEDDLVIIQLDPDLDDSADARATRLTGAAAVALINKLPATEPGEPKKEDVMAYDELKAQMRNRLGVNDADASDETLIQALDQVLEEQATEPQASALPEGVVAIDKSVLEELQAKASRGEAAAAKQDSDRRDGLIKDALRAGKITAASQQKWRTMLDRDEEGTKGLLADMAAGSAVNVTEKGESDGVLDADEDLYNRTFGKNKTKEEVA